MQHVKMIRTISLKNADEVAPFRSFFLTVVSCRFGLTEYLNSYLLSFFSSFVSHCECAISIWTSYLQGPNYVLTTNLSAARGTVWIIVMVAPI